LRVIGDAARLINWTIGWVLVLGLAALLAAPDGLAQDKSPAPKPTSPSPGQPPKSAPAAPTTPAAAWTCRSADNAAAIDAAIAKLEGRVATLKNRMSALSDASLADSNRYYYLLNNLGSSNPQTVAALSVTQQDEKTRTELGQALYAAESDLAALKALPPCLEKKPATAPQPTGPVTTPIPPCRSAENAAAIDAKIAELEKTIASLTNRLRSAESAEVTDKKTYQAFLGAEGPDNAKTKAAADIVRQDKARADGLFVDLSAAKTALSALKALLPCPPLTGPGSLPPGRATPPPQPVPPPPPPPPVIPRAIAPSVAPEHSMAPGLPGTGFYVGFNAGGASGRSQWIEPDPSTNVFSVGGGLAGGTVGYAVQNGPLLFGVEADLAGGSISGSTLVNCFTPCRTSNTYLATVRGRVGYDLGPVTPFVTGGLAVGDVNAHVGGFPGASTTQAGWTAGAGLQLPLAALANGLPEGLTGKIEWLHVDLGSPQVCTPATCGGIANVTTRTDVFRLGINIPLSALIAP
jgi:outer membrane immunogenic protein